MSHKQVDMMRCTMHHNYLCYSSQVFLHLLSKNRFKFRLFCISKLRSNNRV